MLSYAIILTASVVGMGVGALDAEAAAAASATTMKSTSSAASRSKFNKSFKEVSGITDAELRARAGSRSKYSLNASLSYFGAPLADALGEDLPNPDNSPGVHKTSMNGSLAARYRLDRKTSLGFGTGLNVITPFHGAERVDLKDPYLAYDNLYKIGQVQALTSLSATYVTNPDYIEIGEVAGVGLYQSQKIRIGKKWSLGVAVAFNAYIYNRSYENSDRNAANYFLTFVPKATYRLRDNLTIKTSLSRGFRNLRKQDDWSALDNRTLTQKLGLGYALTKDIYINPYLYFFPEQFTWDGTSLSFSTIFSVL